jgi:hypothetical protein
MARMVIASFRQSQNFVSHASTIIIEIEQIPFAVDVDEYDFPFPKAPSAHLHSLS